MAQDPARYRPKPYPPPEFPPRRLPAFARTPPAIFPPILGLMGLVTALRPGLDRWGLPQEAADLAAGLVLPLWAFALCSYTLKLTLRISVLQDDLKVMPSRAALAAGTMGGMVAAGHLGAFAPRLGVGLLAVMLVLHAALAILTVRTLLTLPPEARAVNPGWHMTFVGVIVAAPAAASFGLVDLARVLLFGTLPLAIGIWGASLLQLACRTPPAPLRPMLAIHLAPASLFAITADLLGLHLVASVFAWLVLVIALALFAALRWIAVSGFSALWSAFTFPLSAAATALMLHGGALGWAGQGLLVVVLVANPWIAWRVLKLWPGGQLAARTNAAEA
ncbi:tellurium resistance protein [Rhodobacter calidifons]|uniref:Tellurium resistance protein n=1 Tax=Rhodobacter calidifons TaxID=2715277 RepID=A0ABX0G7M9_9RHOB|nr:tellurium resistance protein [Rhodobacter calidifons]NHB77282.1 tellurium resistance protein [Rhodobacter calidifons]